jgi:hypothetical protein
VGVINFLVSECVYRNALCWLSGSFYNDSYWFFYGLEVFYRITCRQLVQAWFLLNQAIRMPHAQQNQFLVWCSASPIFITVWQSLLVMSSCKILGIIKSLGWIPESWWCENISRNSWTKISLNNLKFKSCASAPIYIR